MLNKPVLVNEITPKPKSVLEFYEGHPERWCQGSSGRVNRDGDYVGETAQACALCLGAAIGYLYDSHFDAYIHVLKRLFRHAFATDVKVYGFDRAWATHESDPWIPLFNDAEGRTFEEIVQVCREARI